MAAALGLKPIEGHGGGAGAVERRPGHQDDLVHRIEDAEVGVVHDPRPGVAQHDVVMLVELVHDGPVVRTAQRAGSVRILRGRQDLQP